MENLNNIVEKIELNEFLRKNTNKLIKIQWNKLINMYGENLKLSEELLHKLEQDEFFINMKENFKTLNKGIENYITNAENPSYQIAIVGAIKAGKSTLINALIGHELASVNVTPETATLTKFKHSEKNSLKVKFYTSIEWNEIWEDANGKKAEVFLEEYKLLNAESVKNQYIDRPQIQMEFNSLETMKKEIARWTSSKEKEHYFVKELEIGLIDLNLPPQICLVDTPGLNDIIDYRSKITRDYIDMANAVIVCVNAKTLRSEELFTIASVFSKARYKKDKIYVLGTQIDTMNSLKDWELQRLEWIKFLRRKEYFESRDMADKHLIGVSSYAFSKSNEISDTLEMKQLFELSQLKLISPEESMKIMLEINENKFTHEKIIELKNRIKNFSNIEKIKNIIDKDLLNDFNESLLKDYIEKYKILKSEINTFSRQITKLIKDKKEDLEKSTEELNKIIETEKAKVKEIEQVNITLEKKLKESKKNFNMDFSELKNNFKKLEEGIKKINIE